MIVFVVCFSIACILLYKLYGYYLRKKKMISIKGICTNSTYKTGYSKNSYIYYYSYTIDDKEYETNDTTRFKHLFFNVKIKDEVNMFVNPDDSKDIITPLDMFYNKIKLYLCIALIILPFLI